MNNLDSEIIQVDIPDDDPSNPFAGVTAFVKADDCLNYSHQRIKQILRDDYGIELVFIHPGYKGGRYPGYVNKYRMRDMRTGEILMDWVRLNDLKYFLARQGHPLYATKGVTRNPGCVKFLAAVEKIRNQNN